MDDLGVPLFSETPMYTIMYLRKMAYEGQYVGIFRKQVVGYSPKGTHIFSLRVGNGGWIPSPKINIAPEH